MMYVLNFLAFQIGWLSSVYGGAQQMPWLGPLAVAGALAGGKTVIRDAAELRVKESDRIATMASNLRLMGVEVEETDDGMVVSGGERFPAAAGIRSYGDHRIAMAMAVLALYAEEPVCVNNTACTETSYPGFWETLSGLGRA